MVTIPHDTVDTLLAPVALHLDQQLEQLAGLDQKELGYLVALSTDREGKTVQSRRALLLDCLVRDVDTHGWDVSWHERGLELQHRGRHVVLGMPASVRTYVGQS